MYKILLDTNVLVDYYLGREPGCTACKSIIGRSQGRHALYAAGVSIKDLYYLVGATLKRMQRSESGALTDAQVSAANESAWGCVKHALDVCIVANTGNAECQDALFLQSIHGDFEDNLVLGAARSIGADYLVTSDEKLLMHSPVGALSPTVMSGLLAAEDVHRA